MDRNGRRSYVVRPDVGTGNSPTLCSTSKCKGEECRGCDGRRGSRGSSRWEVSCDCVESLVEARAGP